MVSPRYILVVLTLLLLPAASVPFYAQGGSPVQPEYTGQPVPAGPSVNEFTGDFTYGLPILTVPGPNGSSYSLALSYQAGSSPNADVSWVGYGWSLNPGAIVRNKRGFPDDWDGQMIYHTKRPPDYTVSKEGSITAEIGSGDLFAGSVLQKLHFNPAIERTFRYDSRTGFGDVLGLSAGVSFLGNYAGLQFTNENGEGSWSGIISPNLLTTAAYLLSDQSNTKEEPSMKDYEVQPFSLNGLWKGSGYGMLKNSISSAGIPITFSSREFEMSPPPMLAIRGESKNIGLNLTISIANGVIVGGQLGTGHNILTVQPLPRQSFSAYGYMRSAVADNDSTGLMDYFYEKDVPYKVDDKFLPIPFSNADIFSVTGGGSFRLYNRNPGGFHQNQISSTIEVSNQEFGVNIGTAWGISERWGQGTVLYDARPWEDPNAPDYHAFTDEGDEPWFFRFSHDMGGTLLYDNNDDVVFANLRQDNSIFEALVDAFRINDVDRFPSLPGDIQLQNREWERPGRSGYVGFTLNKDLLLEKNDRLYKAYNPDTTTQLYWIGDRSAMPEQIGEFALFGPGKSRYVYSLPVYSRNEKNLQLGLRNIRIDSAANIRHNLLAYRYLDQGTAPIAVGQEMTDPYAVAWLLTSITTPDYVDLTGNGPTNDDLGGWTKFHYERISTAQAKTSDPSNRWIYWRSPWNGLSYQEGELSDPEDDLGGYSEGLKELYYLERIETKTHIAIFTLNDPTEAPRKDGYPQFRNYGAARIAGDSTLTSAVYRSDGDPAPNPFRYLDHIALYRKYGNGTIGPLLSTVHFAYDYSLRPNMPNSLPVHPDSTTRYGMLTLRKVWTENLNVKNERIAPIIFGYNYRKSNDYAANVQARYPEVTSFADGLTAMQENPSYSPYDFDAWGNYRPNGAERLDQRFPYIPQNDTTTWDPAAWQLKWVRSSGGGEMQIQYEEDDYSFVHDRPAMAMVSLVDSVAEGFGKQSQDEVETNRYYLRISDMGIDSTIYSDVAKVRELLLQQKKTEKKIFFKFFYALKGGSTNFDDPAYSSEYIEGYADLDTVILQSMDGGAWYAIYVKLIGHQSGSSLVHEHGVPKRVCLDFVHKNKRGKLGPDEGVEYSTNDQTMLGDLIGKYYGFDKDNHCKDIDYARSYIRIPMITSKKGGGLRVKRLLSYDPGLEGDSALYGTEYHYEVYDQERNEVISSGVATNEPGIARDENPLVAYRAREEDDETRGKVMAGGDRARNEGPIGETLLPAAAVGYSRVATHPLHQGATTVGFGVTDFFTFREFPFDARYDAIGNAVAYYSMQGNDFRTNPLFQNFIFYRQMENLLYRSQGYRFILNDMNGQVRRRLSNGGAYTPLESDWVTGAMTEYTYYQPGDAIPLLYRIGDSISYGYPGKVLEIVHASRKNGSYMDDFKIEGDVGFWFLSAVPYVAVNNSELSTHVTTKVVDYPAIVKGVTTYADGNYNYLENVAFDPRSGAPLITRSRDAFDGMALDQSPSGHVGTYVGYSYPLVNVHPEFDQAAGNERARIQSTDTFQIIKAENGSGRQFIDFPGGSESRWLRKLTPGDLIELRTTDDNDDAGRYHIDAVEGTVVWLLPSDLYNASGDPSLSVVDEVVNVEIIHSGRVNVAGAGIGGVSTYGETDAEVATGANFGWGGSGAAARLSFVDQLNDSLLLKAGTFTAANVDSTLEFRLYTTGSCGTLGLLGETFALDTAGNAVIFSSPTYADTLFHLGNGGWFALDDGGQVIYRVKGRPDLSQRVLNLTFCSDDPVYRTVAKVISASASGRMNDTVDYDGGGVASIINEPNAYEKGERGRWGARTTYAYKTGVTPGSRPVAGERVYKDAGVFDDFSLFNWSDPGSSDMEHWFRLDSITGINEHLIPFKGVDMLGHPSITLFNYGPQDDLFPVLSAWNAEEGTVAFESFETYDDGDFAGHVKDSIAHAGALSLAVKDVSFNISLVATQQVLDKGWLVRFWMYPLAKTNAKIRLYTGGTPATFSVTSADRIARAGEWALYEYHLDSADLAPLYSAGDSLYLWFEPASGGDTIRIDDIKIQPADALATGYVFDNQIFRPVAMFDDQNFGLYPQYDAEGKAIRSIVETSRGMKTVAETHIHIPGAVRDWMGEGIPFTPVTATTSGGGAPTTVFNGATDHGRIPQHRQNVDVLHLQFGPDKRELTLFGIEPSRLRDVVQEKIGEFNAFSAEEVELLDRYEALKQEYEELRKRQESASTPAVKEEIESRLRELEAERDLLLEQLGITAR